MTNKSLNLLYAYYTEDGRNARVLDLCGCPTIHTPYTEARDPELTAIINAFARPEYLPLIWEAIQYQTRRPQQTWIVQNHPGSRASVPRPFFEEVRRRDDTLVVDSGLNHGCWFRFLLAALYCRTRYVAIYDDDTLSGRLALETALSDLALEPGIYGGRGIVFGHSANGPHFWDHAAVGWSSGNPVPVQVDFVGHLWIMETAWLRHLFRYLPDRLFEANDPSVECGEDMYLSFVAQKLGLNTWVYRHGAGCNERWSSIQAYEMGIHSYAMSNSGGLSQGDFYLRHFVDGGWKLLQFSPARHESNGNRAGEVSSLVGGGVSAAISS